MSSTYSVGVDLGGTNLRVASYLPENGLLDTIQLPTRLWDGRDAVVRDIAESVRTLVQKQNGGRQLAGVGLGTPGPLELPAGILRNPPNLHNWDGFNLREAVETALGSPIFMESDANAAALAEARLGAGRTHELDSFCILTLGTGVGNGLILNGKVWHGFTGMGGEAGHIVVQTTDGATCGCGGAGCLEQYASATAIVRMARERMGSDAPGTAHEVFLHASSGNVAAQHVFDQVGSSLALALTSLVNTLNLPAYLLAGGVCEAWDLFAPAMFRNLLAHSYVYRLTAPADRMPLRLEPNKTYILPAQLGAAAGLLGACLLPYQHEAPRGSGEHR